MGPGSQSDDQEKSQGPNAWLQIELAGNSVIPEIDSIDLTGNVLVDSLPLEALGDNGERFK